MKEYYKLNLPNLICEPIVIYFLYVLVRLLLFQYVAIVGADKLQNVRYIFDFSWTQDHKFMNDHFFPLL